MADKLFSSGDYELAGEKYMQCLMIDNDNMTYSIFFLNKNVGGGRGATRSTKLQPRGLSHGNQ